MFAKIMFKHEQNSEGNVHVLHQWAKIYTACVPLTTFFFWNAETIRNPHDTC